MLVVQHKPDKSKSDNDNTFVKASLDTMTKYEMWEDDNYTHMKLFLSYSVYDKHDAHTDIIIFPIYKGEYEIGFVLKYVMDYIAKLERKFEVID